MLGIVCAEELKLVCFCMITFIFNVVTLIFFVLAEMESKKMWSNCDSVNPALQNYWFSRKSGNDANSRGWRIMLTVPL